MLNPKVLSSCEHAASTKPTIAICKQRHLQNLAQNGVVKSIHILVARQNLPAVTLAMSPRNFSHSFLNAVMLSEKVIDLVAVFIMKHGAGGVHKDTASFQQGPELLQQSSLQQYRLMNLSGLSEVFYFRMAADNAACRAWRIQQDALEQNPIPPRLRFCGVADHKTGLQVQALQIFTGPFQTMGLMVDSGDDRPRSALEQVAGFASGRSASIQDMHPCAHVQQICRQLGGGILHREMACLETAQDVHVGSGRYADRVNCRWMAVNFESFGFQTLDDRLPDGVVRVPAAHASTSTLGAMFGPVSLERA